jgi:hypothetical protein
VNKKVFQNWFGEKYYGRKIAKWEYDRFVDVFYLWREIVFEYSHNKDFFRYWMNRAYGGAKDLIKYEYEKEYQSRNFSRMNKILHQLLKYKRKIDISRELFSQIFEHITDENLKLLKNSFIDRSMVLAVSSEIICRGKFWIVEKLINVVKIDPKFILNEILKSEAHTKIYVDLITIVNNTLRLKKIVDDNS